MLWGVTTIGKEPLGLDEFNRRVALKQNRKIKVFGERNTGTRAVIRMLRSLDGVSISFPDAPMPDLDLLSARVEEALSGFHRELYNDALQDIRRERLAGLSAWKHAAPVIDGSYLEKAASVLFLVRDPYSWIAALYRHPYHKRTPKQKSLEAFLQCPWLTTKRDNTEPILLSPMMLWNEKLRAYCTFAAAAPVPSTVLSFEAFVVDPVGALAEALDRFGIASAGLAEIEEPTKTKGVDRENRLAYYRAAKWEQELSPKAVKLINALVDWDVAATFGYQKRAPSEFQ